MITRPSWTVRAFNVVRSRYGIAESGRGAFATVRELGRAEEARRLAEHRAELLVKLLRRAQREAVREHDQAQAAARVRLVSSRARRHG